MSNFPRNFGGVPKPKHPNSYGLDRRTDRQYLSTGARCTLCAIRRIEKQKGLAVASIARDVPSPLHGMHRDHNALPSLTDGQTDTDIVA